MKFFIHFLAVVWCSGILHAQAQEPSPGLAAVAQQILDANKPAPEGDALIAANAKQSAQLIVELAKQIKVGTPDEYRAIPAIWKAAIAAGKRNNDSELKEILDASLPQRDEPLRDWQAV